MAPLSPERYKIQFTASAETCRTLRQLQELLRHQIPDGDPAAVVDLALNTLLGIVKKRKLAIVDRPRQSEPGLSNSRHIPSSVKRNVWRRDEGQCAFSSAAGHRCAERGWLEFHHLEPYAKGGPASPENIELRCRAHNVHEAELAFGLRFRQESG